MYNRPLKDFFDLLRANGFSLGIAEYEDFLVALEGNFLDLEKNTYESLKRLTQLLWFNPGNSKELFNELFEFSWNKEIEKRKLNEQTGISDGEVEKKEETEEKAKTDTTKKTAPAKAETPEEVDEKETPIIEPEASYLNPKTSYWLSLKSSHFRAEDAQAEEETLPQNAIRLGGGYFPIRPRSLELIWRFLKVGGESIPSNQLDVNETVTQFARKGGLIKPIYISRMEYATRLLVLIDHSPSMAAFHDFSTWMAKAAPVHHFSNIPSTLYFSNVPEESLYKTPGQLKGFSIRHLRDSFERKPLRIIILSDAGAARGDRSGARVLDTRQALRAIAPFTLSMVWINPMPKHRWLGTSAEEISNMVPMVEARNNGLIHAVNILRGKIPQKAIG